MRVSRARLAAVVVLLGLILAATAAAAGGGAAVSWRTTSIGNAITTANGRTLYLFRGDSGTTSRCYGSCATYWPPLLSTGKPHAIGRVDASLLGTTKRTDGARPGDLQGPPALHVRRRHEAGPGAR